MTKSTITRKQLIKKAQEQIEFCRHTKITGEGRAHINQCAALFEIALAAMDSEPVAWLLSGGGAKNVVCFDSGNAYADPLREVTQLYRHAQPAKTVQPVMFIDGDISSEDADKLAKVIREFNEEDERPLAKMARIIRENPHPTNECDTPKAQSAPVVPENVRQALSIMDDEIIAELDAEESACRAAMLAAAPHDTPALNSVQNVVTVPGKWIPVSERMPEDEQEVLTINKMGHRFVSFFDKHSGLFFDRLDAPAACCIEHVLVTHWMPLPAAPQEVKGE
ncbi:DUF551 domain-containing protein [Klebsiella pneumoniae]|uniref:DUF551 domain-containing protein n=1 Tax=Klebsiella pneumoniae TaxID=573 RepID=UPI0010EE9212|nr:DUF551 domain-containing protein [Klebsiella pneumoniae]MCQ0571487.1 DUF551 domain-containing protein [Klebsiella pneumoniae]CAE6358828.1 hypothetical protein AI2713V1_3063 [Klebsiella pneumoniae]CAE7102235.1 hypothetical protein AI2701V1_3071 [Klebsiella pneumoniae]CAH3576057.1 hypothetical protein AI2713V1_3063 [Klebsiella pneumoniae]CAH3770576.1 hypothetical protein AI2701V1_3071 [Klebsiella pneumoniae]